MEKKVNSEGYPASCRNCNYWGNRGKIEMQFSNKGNKSKKKTFSNVNGSSGFFYSRY